MWWRYGEGTKAREHAPPHSTTEEPTEVDVPKHSNLGWKGWTSNDEHIDIKISEGTGQKDAPFCVQYEEFQEQCTKFGFTGGLLGLFRPYTALLEFCHSPPGSRKPRYMELVMANYENDAFIAFLRCDLTGRTTKCILFVKTFDYQPRLSAHDVYSWLNEHGTALSQHPLQLLSSILAMVQSRSCKQDELRRDLNDLESELGVTKEKEVLLQHGYSEESIEFLTINQTLVSLSKKVANCRVSATTIITHTHAMRRALKSQPMDVPSYELQTTNAELFATETRSQMDLKVIMMAETMLQTLSAVLYRRISKRDSDSMVTIAVVTTLFLPYLPLEESKEEFRRVEAGGKSVEAGGKIVWSTG